MTDSNLNWLIVWLILNYCVEGYRCFRSFGYGDLDFVKIEVKVAAVSPDYFYNANFPHI